MPTKTARVYDCGYEEDQYEEESEEQYVEEGNFVWCNTANDNLKPNSSQELQVCDSGSITFKLDTGADTSVISKTRYNNLPNKPPLQKSTTDILGLGGQPIHPIGCVKLPARWKNKNYTISCEVLNAKVPSLLCLSDCMKMNLIQLVNSNTENPKKTGNKDTKESKIEWPQSMKSCKYCSAKQIIEDYSHLFIIGVGKVPGKVDLKVNPDVTPVAHPPKPIPVALRDTVLAKLQDLEQQDIIEKIPVGTPTPWCSALHIVPKKDNTVRLTIDPRDLNKALLREYHPTNTMEEVAQRCKSTKYLTVLDANQGYFQLELDEQSRNCTAFNTPYGRYRYKRLQMGITSAPEIFQRVFRDIFASVDGLEIIIDDFLIAATSLEEHNRILRQTLQTGKENNVTFSPKKLQLCTDCVKYGGHVFTNKGIQLDPDRIRAIVEMPEPECIEKVHTLLGMVTYVCKYLKDLSYMTEPLRGLIKESHEQGFKWHFDKVHKEAFQKIKDAMTSAPVLRYYSSDEPVVISCDTTQCGHK